VFLVISLSEATSGLGGDTDGEGGFSELIEAAKEAAQATGETISKVTEAATLAIEIPSCCNSWH
jgi:hypothetical protein